MADYAFENWPTNDLGSPTRIVGTVYFVDEAIAPEPLHVKVRPHNAGTMEFWCAHQREKMSRVELHYDVYKGIVEALLVEQDEDHQETFIRMLHVMHSYLRKYPSEDAAGFYLRNPELEGAKARFMADRRISDAGLLMDTLMDSEEVFAQAREAMANASQRTNFEDHLCVAVSLAGERAKPRAKARLGEYIVHMYPKSANTASVALFLADDYDDSIKLKGAILRAFWDQKKPDKLALPEGL